MIEDSLLLHHGGFDSAPFAPEEAVGRAECEQSERFGTYRGRFPKRRRRIRCRVRRGEGGEADRIGDAPITLTIMLGKDGIDAEEFRRRRLVAARREICPGLFQRRILGSQCFGCSANTERENDPRGRMQAWAPQFYARRHDVPFCQERQSTSLRRSAGPNLLSGRKLRPSPLMVS
ncbi:hypothetical protein V1278_006081 [Bradyrhizobium sp. AZCC 1577]|uniref:hypothetical protein n=1 Tax=Bradyrhizobium sp. AZCC 1577 TaxID=3117019 RepID=UPI002FF305E3